MVTANLDDILIGVGLETIRFGTTVEELTGILGEAEEIDDHSQSVCSYTDYIYKILGLSFFFDVPFGSGLSTIITRRETARLYGTKLIGHGYDEVVEILTAILGDEEIDEYNIDDKIKYIDRGYCESNIRFWFADARLESILWGAPYEAWDQWQNSVKLPKPDLTRGSARRRKGQPWLRRQRA